MALMDKKFISEYGLPIVVTVLLHAVLVCWLAFDFIGGENKPLVKQPKAMQAQLVQLKEKRAPKKPVKKKVEKKPKKKVDKKQQQKIKQEQLKEDIQISTNEMIGGSYFYKIINIENKQLLKDGKLIVL